MFRSSRILGVDIGASSVKVGEFTVSPGGGLQLVNFHWGELGIDSSQEDNRGPAIISTIQQLLKERKIKPGPAVISVSGQAVFTRFVKLPIVEEKKVLQIVKYEAAQNVPFPIEEVVWDYQLIGGTEAKELEVVLVAIKSDIIEELARFVEKAGLRTTLVDVATMSLYNAVRYNYGDMEGTTLLLDVGARTANLIFIEKQKIFSRNMPIAGNTITQAIASELQISNAQAEDLKRRIGFVGLGGAYEEPSSEQAAKVSKIIRNVMTRLHAGISQTINFYRTQHGGSAPVRLLLSGGTSIIPYTDQFFREKLQIDVAYFNPFKSIEIGPNVSREDLSKCGHFLGEVVGLGLRKMSECPIEVNLVPKSVVWRKSLERKYPYLAGAALCIILAILCWVAYEKKVTGLYENQINSFQQQVDKFHKTSTDMDKERKQHEAIKAKIDQLQWVVATRTLWSQMLTEVNSKLPSTDLWLTSFVPCLPRGAAPTARKAESRFGPMPGEEMEMPGVPGRGGRGGRVAAPEPGKSEEGQGGAEKPKDVKAECIDISGQGINDPGDSSRRYALVHTFVSRLAANTNLFVIENVDQAMKVTPPQSSGDFVFSFSVQVKLKTPITVRP